MGTLRRLPAALSAAVVLLVVLATMAAAQTLSDRIVDEAGVLSQADADEAREAIDRLDDQQNVQLWALFVDTTGGQPITDFADAVAADNGLGGNDALLVVAVDDRRDAIWVGDLLEAADDEELDRILADGVEPQLRDAAWGAAVVAAADGLADALDGDSRPEPEPEASETPEPDPGEAPGADDDGAPGLLPLLIGLGLAGFGGWLVWTRLSGDGGGEDRERSRRLRGLAERANALLIETDEMLRHDQQELGFAEAEFGAEAAAPFRTALDAARAELQAAFRSRQQLDDADPETPAEREQLLSDVVARCERAQAMLEEQTDRFRELRDLERRAPEVLDALEGSITSVEGRLPEAGAALETLREEASGSSQAVHGNVAEARKRVELARRGSAEGRAALERGERGAAARAAKASQDALAQASALLDAVGREAEVLAEARAGVEPALARARADLDAAARAVDRATETDQRDELVAARAQLDAAEAAHGGSPRDLVLAYRMAREAESAAEGIVARVREGEERRAGELAAADAAIRAAELSADRAADFIGGRRHGVGRRARTALSESETALERARARRDREPREALADAQRASQLADDAYDRARRDFDSTVDRGRGGTVVIGGRPYPTGRDANWGADVGGAIIGGIIGSILSGGGRGRGGGPFGGFGGGGFSGGGFGGGGGGRTFGGGFGGGGGGGRSRGGGW